jgi:hypothetical protein
MRKRNIKKIPKINICYFRKELNVNKYKIIFSLKKAEKGLKLLEKIANKRNSFFSLLNKNNDIKNDLRENLNIITINNYDVILNKISDLILANKNITTIIRTGSAKTVTKTPTKAITNILTSSITIAIIATTTRA